MVMCFSEMRMTYIELVQNGDFDIIFADGCMERMTPEFKGIFVDTRTFCGVWKS